MWYGMNWIRKDLRLAILDRDECRCVYCETDESLGLDHLRPRALGGNNEPTNLAVSCVSCNSRKGDTLWQYFADEDAKERIRKFRKRGLIVRRNKAKKLLERMPWSDAVEAVRTNGLT